jgi:hypothetical protein
MVNFHEAHFFLLCALLLMADLAADGCFGKVQPAVSSGPRAISFTSPVSSLGKVETQVCIPATNLIGIRQRWQTQSVFVAVDHAPSLTHPYLFSSSGGISW